MMIKNKILFSGILFLLFATGLQAAKTELVPELKTVNEYFDSGVGEILAKNKKTEKLKALIEDYHVYFTKQKEIKDLLTSLVACQDTYDAMKNFSKDQILKNIDKAMWQKFIFVGIKEKLKRNYEKSYDFDKKNATEEQKYQEMHKLPVYSAKSEAKFILDKGAWKIGQLWAITGEASKLRNDVNLWEDVKGKTIRELFEKFFKEIQYSAQTIIDSLKTTEERFLGVLSSVGGIKKEDLEKAKAAMTAGPIKKESFKYTQSIAHLLVMLDFEKGKKLCEYYKYLGKKENIKKEFNKTLADSVFEEYETCLKEINKKTLIIRQMMEKEPTILEKETQIKNIESEINTLDDSPTRDNKVQKKFNMIAERTKELDDKIRDEIKKSVPLQKIIKRKNEIDETLKATNLWGYYDYLVLQKNDEEIKKFRETFDKVILCEYYDSFIKKNNDEEKIKNFKNNNVNSLKYYDYLVQNKDVMEIQKFEEALIKEAIRINEREDRYKEKMKDPYFLNIFNTAIKREEVFKDKFVFYSGYSSNFDFLNDFLTTAENLIFLEKKLRERSFFQEKLKMFATMNDFWNSEEGGYIKSGEKDDGKLTDYLCSTNIALFGNLFNSAANTYSYFTHGMSQQDPVPSLIKNLSKSIGLDFDSFESSIKELHEKYKKIGGKLKQFFISPDDVNKLAYMSIHRGHPFLVRDHVLAHASAGFRHFAYTLLDGNIDTIEKVITFLRNNPDHEEFLKTFELKGSHGVAIDYLQARVLMSPMLFDKEKVKIFYYFLSAEKEREHRFLEQELRDLVVKMIIDGLEKGAIQKNKVKVEGLGKTVKLPSLFKKVTKPVYTLYGKISSLAFDDAKYKKTEELQSFYHTEAFEYDNAYRKIWEKDINKGFYGDEFCIVKDKEPVKKTEDCFRIMSFNVHNFHNVCDRDNVNKLRKDPTYAYDAIIKFKPDIVLLQEMVPYAAKEALETALKYKDLKNLQSVLVDFSFFDRLMSESGFVENVKVNDFEHTKIEKFKNTFMGKAIYTTEGVIKDVDAGILDDGKDDNQRGYIRILFQYPDSDEKILVYNVHLSYWNDEAVIYEINKLVTKVIPKDKNVFNTENVIVMGDFNNSPYGKKTSILFKSFSDNGYTLLNDQTTTGALQGFFVFSGITDYQPTIDLVYVSKGFLEKFEILNPTSLTEKEKYTVAVASDASDHWPIYIDFELKNKVPKKKKQDPLGVALSLLKAKLLGLAKSLAVK